MRDRRTAIAAVVILMSAGIGRSEGDAPAAKRVAPRPKPPAEEALPVPAAGTRDDGPVARIIPLGTLPPTETADRLRKDFGKGGLTAVADHAGRRLLLRGPAPLVAEAAQWVAAAERRQVAPPKPAAGEAADIAAVRLHKADPEQVARLLIELFPNGLEVTVRLKSRAVLLEGEPAAVRQAAGAARELDGDAADPDAAEADEQARLELRTRTQLATIKPSLDLAGVPLDKAIEILREQWGATLVVNYEALAGAGVDTEKLINLPKLKDVSLRKVLDMIFEQIGAFGDVSTRPGFVVDGPVIRISTNEMIMGRPITVIYDVRDLIALRQAEPAAADAPAEEIKKEVRRIDPDVFGGQDKAVPEPQGQLRVFLGLMVVQAPRTSHEKIRTMLAEIRRALRNPAP